MNVILTLFVTGALWVIVAYSWRSGPRAWRAWRRGDCRAAIGWASVALFNGSAAAALICLPLKLKTATIVLAVVAASILVIWFVLWVGYVFSARVRRALDGDGTAPDDYR